VISTITVYFIPAPRLTFILPGCILVVGTIISKRFYLLILKVHKNNNRRSSYVKNPFPLSVLYDQSKEIWAYETSTSAWDAKSFHV